MGILKKEKLHACDVLQQEEVRAQQPEDPGEVVLRWRCDVCNSEWSVRLWKNRGTAICLVRRRMKPINRICRLPRWL